MPTLKDPSLLRRAPWTWASHRKSHVLPAPQRIEELLHGHDCDSVDTPRAGLKAHANMTLELPLLGEGPQRAHVPGRDDFLGLHRDPRVVAEDEVHLEPRGRSPIAEWLTGDVVPVDDELVHEIGLNPLAELGRPGAELAALERGSHASIEEVKLRRGKGLALQGLPPRRQLVKHERVLEDFEVLVDRRARNLGVVGDVGEVDDRPVRVSGHAQEPAEGWDIASCPLSDDLLLEIGPGVGREIRLRIVREVDRRNGPELDLAGDVEAAAQFSRDQRVEIPGPRPTPEQVHAAATEFARARPRQQELDPAFLDQTLDLVQRSEEHTSELQSRSDLVCRLLLEKKKETDVHDAN